MVPLRFNPCKKKKRGRGEGGGRSGKRSGSFLFHQHKNNKMGQTEIVSSGSGVLSQSAFFRLDDNEIFDVVWNQVAAELGLLDHEAMLGGTLRGGG